MNYSTIDHELLNKIICDLGKVVRGTPNQSVNFSPAYLGGSDKLRVFLEVSLCFGIPLILRAL